MNKNVLEHHNIMVQIGKAVENFFCARSPFPEELINMMISRDDDHEWRWFFLCFERVLGRFASSGYNSKDFILPVKLQEAILIRAKHKKFDEVERYIKLMPFDESQHLLFWTVCRKNRRSVIDDYVGFGYPLIDEVLDRYWKNSTVNQKENYLIHNTITVEMAKKMWCAAVEKNPKKWAQFYLKHHPVPDGVAEGLYADIPYVIDIWDLVEYSTQPFGNLDEITVVKKLRGDDAFPYIDKFGLKESAQLAMLESKNKKLIKHYIDDGWGFCLEAQRYMLTPEFLKDGGKELLAHYLTVEPKPFNMELEERIQMIFG